MKTTCVAAARCTSQNLSLVVAALCVIVAFSARPILAKETSPEGRLDFEAAKLPAANLEVDLSQDTFHSLFGISDAAIAGVAETLLKSEDGEEGKDKHVVARHVEAVRKIVELGGMFVREVRVRAYESFPDGTDADSLLKPFDAQLKAGKWETVVRVRSDDDMVRVAMLQKEGSIRGMFVAATDGEEIAVVNIVCDISPDKVKPFTAAVAEVGKSLDLQPIIKWQMSQIADSSESAADVAVHTLTVATKTATPAATPAAEKARK